MFYQIAAPYLTKNEKKYILEAIDNNWISSKSENVSRFENKFARYVKTKYAISTDNGTNALHLALLALNIKENDEVIVPCLTFAATINAVLYTGAIPIIVDIKKENWCISPEKIRKAISPKTKAIIPVHVYGQPCDMDSIMEIASEYGINVVEDCAEAQGAEYNGKKVGTFGIIGCFSFYVNKVITTGEGGMCVTDDKKIAEKISILKNHGMNPKKKYWHDYIGYNYRMTNLQASFGLAQLEKIDEILKKRKKIEKFYIENLSDSSFFIPQSQNIEKTKKITWLVSFLLKPKKLNRDKFIKKLYEMKIETRPFFYPLSRMNIYRKFVDGVYPIADNISKSGISFPTNLNLTQLDYRDIVSKIKSVAKYLAA